MDTPVETPILRTAETLTALGVILASIAATTKRVRIYANRVLDRLFPANVILARMDQQDAAIAAIRAEVTPNGGGSMKDILRQAYDRIVLQEMRQNFLRATAPVALYENDSDGRCIWVNDRLCELFGMEHEEMLGNGWLTALESDQRIDEQGFWMECVKRDIPYSREYVIQNKRTGKRTRCKTTACAHRDARGRVLMFQGIVEPIEPIQ